MPGVSGTSLNIIFESSLVQVIPEIMALSRLFSSLVIKVPPELSKLDSTLIGISYLLANSTDLICKTLAPKLESSNISSKQIFSIFFAFLYTLGSVV